MTKSTLLALLFIFPVLISNAQDTLAPKNNSKWHFLAEPYLLFPNMKGTIGLGNLPDASLDLNVGDIFNQGRSSKH
jgi:hypothetical protein